MVFLALRPMSRRPAGPYHTLTATASPPITHPPLLTKKLHHTPLFCTHYRHTHTGKKGMISPRIELGTFRVQSLQL